ncbi:pentatricopeptide repeat-containing protein [Pyrus ussuriensis x Pyrus communis]|uniref:Pentatricopeptide repeat-containing protein n=1 Tax=Pyrus ussuriensis x Pyrus communis TaxID=2448454 RepID=A0A5N5H3R8_9ROSA|nr:pentatricopeptide repeat-containing protein [Pyrus ussuriensis x Pyrus communis]
MLIKSAKCYPPAALIPKSRAYSTVLPWTNAGVLALSFFRWAEKQKGFKHNTESYNALIEALAKRYDEVIELFREMESKNVKATPHVFCILINGLGSGKRLSEALEFFELNKASGFETEAPTYNALVGAYCWARRTEQAYSIFQQISREPGCEPTVTTYEIMVRMFCNEDRVDMALQVWDQMKTRGVLPRMHMFSTLINSLCHGNKLDDAYKYFQETLDSGNRPPAQLFSNLKQALLDEGRKDVVISLGL